MLALALRMRAEGHRTGTFVTHSIASSLTAGKIAAGQATVSVLVVSPDRWSPDLGSGYIMTGRVPG